MTLIIPKKNCCVRHSSITKEYGLVDSIEFKNNTYILKAFFPLSKSFLVKDINEFTNGFLKGMTVKNIPNTTTKKSLGEGIVIETRNFGGSEQVLVHFHDEQTIVWMPYQSLVFVYDVAGLFLHRKIGNIDKFRLRNLAYSLELWHENTGGLSPLDIDPLPHQIYLVHQILISGNYNWMIADDVGLGKTIEIGMLISALKAKKFVNRVLIITPASLVSQWKEEMYYRFKLRDFEIYGKDFNIDEFGNWKRYNYVIASIDKLKTDEHLLKIQKSGNWDLIIFDEAHRLSRTIDGLHYRSTGRFRLAAKLRKQTESMILLTATPHQGKQDKFQSLLELIRPELKKEIHNLSNNYSILKNIIFRNSKSEAIDVNGNLIFKGKIVKTLAACLNDDEKLLNDLLRDYLLKGYNASINSTSNSKKLISFVMTIYRKLAASSNAAILSALRKRLVKLNSSISTTSDENHSNDVDDSDERFETEKDEDTDTGSNFFFNNELAILKDLILQAEKCFKNDSKATYLIETVIPNILKDNSESKILIFTEYRTTQTYIQTILGNRFGVNKVTLINGSMKLDERLEAIQGFAEEKQFLISTEAGGEGINLQKNCNIMINYDLPWNPMRLVQRIGRLYRYGQNKTVLILNMSTKDSMDGQLLNLLYERIDQIVKDMSTVGDEFKPGLEAEIIGELCEALDIEELLNYSITFSPKLNETQMNDALKKAQDAVVQQRELLSYASSYSKIIKTDEFKLEPAHLEAFCIGMFDYLNIEVINKLYDGEVFEVKLPESIKESISANSIHKRITFQRSHAIGRKNIEIMDSSSTLLKYLVNYAKNDGNEGKVAVIDDYDNAKYIQSSILKWQDEQGRIARQEYFTVTINRNDQLLSNDPIFSKWLINPHNSIHFSEINQNESLKEIQSKFNTFVERRLNEISSDMLFPESKEIISAAYILDK